MVCDECINAMSQMYNNVSPQNWFWIKYASYNSIHGGLFISKTINH